VSPNAKTVSPNAKTVSPNAEAVSPNAEAVIANRFERRRRSLISAQGCSNPGDLK
jgi:hypothetical protein